jgi:hypothetical protein
MGVYIDCISHCTILVTVRRLESSVRPCSGARHVASGMSLFHSELWFVAFWSESCEQAATFFDLANVFLLIFDLR